MGDATRAPEKRALTASMAAVGSILVASSCCLPLLPFFAAAGAAGGSAIFAAARPYLVAASLLLLAWGFYEARRAKQCSRKPSAIHMIALWTAAVFIAVSLLFPQLLANATAALVTR